MAFDWRAATSPLVRELGWCLFSAPIIDTLPPATTTPWPCREDRGAGEILGALDRDPRPLQRHLASLSDKRLGARFEAMWIFYLASHPQFELLAHQLPVPRNGQTLGALDLLFRDHHLGAVVHGEIAVKFYLYHPEQPGTALEKWIGPNPDDSLAAKIGHLANHQLPLSTRDETQRRLQTAGLPSAQLRATVIKGFLFHPWRQSIALPAPCNPGHLRGEWLYRRELPALFADNPRHSWAVLPKQQWLTQVENGDSHSGRARREMAAKISSLLDEQRQPVMFYGHPVARAESIRRFFVAPDGWPGIRRATTENLAVDAGHP
ncbi:MAG: DUF1853 family protein [Porticoccaceae bacterium]